MLQTLLLITAAHTAAICELPPTSPASPPALSSPLSAESDRRPWPGRLRDRVDRRRARRDPSSIDRTLARFFRSLRHRIAERRGHRSARLFRKLRARQHERRAEQTEDPPSAGVTVPHEDPVDLPLYPQPDQ